MKYRAILFDFDGVLSHDRFYTTLNKDYPEVYKFIQTEIFGGKNDLVNKWMRNELSMYEVNQEISNRTGIDFQELTKLFETSVRSMKLDQNMLKWQRKISENNIQTALVTNNMDVFNEITISNHNLDTIFPVIVNSCDYGILKHEHDGKLFDITIEMLGLSPSDYSNFLMIDDSEKVKQTFEAKGGVSYLYSNFDEFDEWAKGNLLT